MNESPLKSRLRPVAQRHRWIRLARSVAWVWLGAAAGSLGVWLVLSLLGIGSPWTLPVLAGWVALMTVGLGWREWQKPISWREAAESVEKAFPDLRGLVLTAVQQEPDAHGDLQPLQQRVVARAVTHGMRHDWRLAVSFSRLVQAVLPAMGALIVLGFVGWLNYQPASQKLEETARRIPLIRSGVEVTPGNVQLEKGESLVVLARFGGAPPAGADLIYRTALGREQRVPLARNLKDPVFGGTVSEIGEDLTYHVEYAGKSTAEYRVTVYEHPRLVRADADLTFPTYTRLPARRIEDTRRITGVEGTRVDLTLNLNKAVATAQLVPRSTNLVALSLQFTTNRAVLQLTQSVLETSGTYDLRLVDTEGRTNKVPSSLVFEVQRNRIPEMKLASPKGDVRPSALEEIHFEGTVWDDFGIEAYGLAYTVSNGEVRTVQLGGPVAAQTRVPFQLDLRLEELGVRPDQLLAWFVWADDLGPDGLLRRNQSDMFYAEIRPFETVYREGEGAGGGGEGGGEEAGGGGVKKLAEMQKQIINATWKLQREHSGRSKLESRGAPTVPPASPPAVKPAGGAGLNRPGSTAGESLISSEFREKWLRGSSPWMAQTPREPAEPRRQRPARLTDTTQRPAPGASRAARSVAPVSFDADIQVVRESMEKALEQAKETQAEQDDPRSAALWATVVKDMETAVKQLQATRTAADLPQALTAQRAAYEGLLKLREREARVQRGQRQPGSGQSEGEQMTDRQMEQLDLEQSENKYETQRQAQAAANPQQRETQQVLNRLAELARRQQDMNAQLKELQAALQEARTESEREAAKRRLKRLQEEQQQMLADADELQQRMNREENQSRMSEQRRQLEQTREELQQAAEATGEGQVSKALTSGTRAQRQLQEMRENLRRENSSEMADELKELRTQSRELLQKQAEISKQMQEPAPSGRKSLASQDNTDALAKQLSEQRARMTNLLARATAVSSQAEASEPLVSRQLYDSLRKFATDDTTNVKRLREQLARDGVLSDSGNARLKQLAEGEGAKTLQAAEEFMQRGGRDIARSINQVAEKDIETLTRGVERAAESVLGDDTETLRTAQQELDTLTRQLEREMSQLRGTNGPTGATGGSERSNAQQTQNRPGGAAGGTNAPTTAATSPGGQPESADTGPSPNGEGQKAATAGESAGASPQGRGRGSRPGEGEGESPQAQDSSASRSGQRAGKEPGQAGQTEAQENAQAEAGTPGQGQGQGQVQGQAQGQGQASGERGRPPQRRLSNNRNSGSNRSDDLSSFFSGGTETRGAGGPITGGNYAEWSDRLRDVEEMMDQTDLRTEVAAARDQARLMRIEYNRAGKKPDWATLDRQVIRPLVEVRARLQEELARRGSRENLIPIDRDPVPNKYAESVRRYYEQLGQRK